MHDVNSTSGKALGERERERDDAATTGVGVNEGCFITASSAT